MVKKTIKKRLEKFENVLKKKGIKVEKMLLYGSYAKKTFHKDSDIDVAVISSDFGKDRFKEGIKLFEIAYKVDPRIEPVPISLKSYKKDTWIPLIYEIRKNGIKIK